MPPPFHLMWTQTHAKVWGQSHCLVSSWLLLGLLIFLAHLGPSTTCWGLGSICNQCCILLAQPSILKKHMKPTSYHGIYLKHMFKCSQETFSIKNSGIVQDWTTEKFLMVGSRSCCALEYGKCKLSLFYWYFSYCPQTQRSHMAWCPLFVVVVCRGTCKVQKYCSYVLVSIFKIECGGRGWMR